MTARITVADADDLRRAGHLKLRTGPKKELGGKNLHFPLRYKEGAIAMKIAYNGYVFTAANAEELPIPELPEGFLGITSQEHLRCKNFRFGVSVFGDPRCTL